MTEDTSKIILDVDTGTDDAMAIVTAMKAIPDRLMAITVTHGNRPLPNTLENTLRVVQFMGGGVPVYGGMPGPIVQHLAPGRLQNQHRQRYQQEHGGKQIAIHEDFLDLPEAEIEPQRQHAVSFLVDTLRNTEEKITIIAVGPASNIATALQMDPSIARNIKQLIVMGGGHDAVNITSAAEANFYWDPEAAHIMLHADCPIVLFPLDATTSILFNKEDAETIAAAGTDEARFIASLIVHWNDRLKLLGIRNNMSDDEDYSIAMHDVFCVLYLIDDSFVLEKRRQNCDVDIGGSVADGRLIVDTRSYSDPEGDIQIVYRLDKSRVLELLDKLLR